MFLTCDDCGKLYDRQDGHECRPELPRLEPIDREVLAKAFAWDELVGQLGRRPGGQVLVQLMAALLATAHRTVDALDAMDRRAQHPPKEPHPR